MVFFKEYTEVNLNYRVYNLLILDFGMATFCTISSTSVTIGKPAPTIVEPIPFPTPNTSYKALINLTFYLKNGVIDNRYK
jgi:hypothetical protein